MEHEQGNAGNGKASGKGEGKGKAMGENDTRMSDARTQMTKALCRKHNRMEYACISIQLPMQLGCGVLTYEQWVRVISRLYDGISSSSSDDDNAKIVGHNSREVMSATTVKTPTSTAVASSA
jgi:hypothetical protein